MADTQTPNVLLTNQQEGSNNNTWGTIADANFEEIDDKFGDTTSISSTGGTTVLSSAQEIVAAIDCSGVLASNKIIQFSGRGGVWVVRNNHTGAFSLTCKLSASTGVVIPSDTTKVIWCDGTDIRFANTDEDVSAEVTVASAATCDILGAGSEFVAISGTGTITSLGSTPNTKRFVRATGAFKLTNNASIILPGAQDIVAASGDTFIAISSAAGVARIYAYQRAATPPASVPIGVVHDYAGPTAPAFHIFPFGQAVSRTTYAALFAIIGTTYGVGDSVSTFNLPDLCGRVVAGKDDMGGTSKNRLTAPAGVTGGFNGDTLGASGGLEVTTMARNNMPNVTLTGTTNTTGAHTHTVDVDQSASSNAEAGGGRSPADSSTSTTSSNGNHSHTVTTESINGGTTQTDMNNVQPTIVLNKIMFVGV